FESSLRHCTPKPCSNPVADFSCAPFPAGGYDYPRCGRTTLRCPDVPDETLRLNQEFRDLDRLMERADESSGILTLLQLRSRITSLRADLSRNQAYGLVVLTYYHENRVAQLLRGVQHPVAPPDPLEKLPTDCLSATCRDILRTRHYRLVLESACG